MLKPGILIFTFFLSLFILTSGGHFYTQDGYIMFKVAENIVEHGQCSVDGLSPLGLTRGTDGRFYSPYGLGMSLVYVPFYATGKFLSDLPAAPNLTLPITCLANSVVSATGLAVFYSLAYLMGFSKKKSLLLTFFLGFSGLAWPYAKHCFAEPLAGLGAVLCAFYAVKSVKDNRLSDYFFLGASMGVMLLARLTTALFIPAYLLYIFLAWREQSNLSGQGVLKKILMIGLGALPWILIWGWYNEIRFGHWALSGYHAYIVPSDKPSWGFTTPFFVGLYGMIFSAGKSIFLYVPLSLLTFPALRRWYKTSKKEVLMCSLLIAESLIFFSSWVNWDGGISWGPRYLYPVAFAMILPLGALLDNRVWVKITIGLLFLAGLSVNILGISVDFAEYIGLLMKEEGHRWYALNQFHPGYSPVVGHAVLFVKKAAIALGMTGENPAINPHYDFGFARILRSTLRGGSAALLVLTFTSLASLLGLFFHARRRGTDER